ncbi:ceramide kinase-like [Arapaima gigas]
MERERAVLSARFLVKLAVCEVTLRGDSLTWSQNQDPGRAERNSVPVSEIIAVEEAEPDAPTKNRGRGPSTAPEVLEARPSGFTVSYVERGRHHCWLTRDVTFHCPSRATCHQWVQTIRELLLMLTRRPRRLLVYINPYGGKQRGKWIYEQRVAPLFARASISTHVIVTQSENQARDELATSRDLKKYDGVVSVGGDGMFSEVVHGLIARTQRDAGVDQNCAEEKLVSCKLRVGIIPAGSTDCICYATVGTNDPVTSALHIIVGDSQPMDICSVHHGGKLLRYSMSLLGFGFYGDVLTDSERKRWMGPVRYSFSGKFSSAAEYLSPLGHRCPLLTLNVAVSPGFQTFLSHHLYEGTISFLPATDILGSPRDKTRCRAGCPVCQHNGRLLSQDRQVCGTDEDVPQKAEQEAEWQVVHGNFVAINAATMSCACPRSPEGLSPAAHLADGTTDLILVHNCSLLDFLRHLMRHTNEKDQFDMSFVEVHRVRRFRFTPKNSRGHQKLEKKLNANKPLEPTCRDDHAYSSWTCDGEILKHVAVEVRVHWGLIQLFARGIED